MLNPPFVKRISTSARLASNLCKTKKKKSSELYKKNIEKCICKDFCPLPVVIKKGRGVYLYDAEGKSYLDFIAGNGAVSLGHCHPKISRVLCEHAKILTHSTRDLLTIALADYGEYITELFCYDKVLPMTTGSEACDAAVKMAREWGYKCKGICANRAKVLLAENSYWGATVTGSTSSSDVESSSGTFELVPFNDPVALDCKARDPNVCAFMLEPIQGSCGVVVPDPCYLKQVREICNRCGILMIADEILCGLGRTGCMLSTDLYRVRPDILILGKPMSAGFTPVSAVLADSDVMDVVEGKPMSGTFSGNPLSCKIAMEVLKTIQQENLIENARAMGEVFRGCLCDLPKDIVCEIRGVGLLNALILNTGICAWDVSKELMNNGLLAKPGQGETIRLCPPLTIKEQEILKATKIIRHCIENSRGNCGGKDEGSTGKKKKCKSSQGRKKITEYFDINFKQLNVAAKLAESFKKFRIN